MKITSAIVRQCGVAGWRSVSVPNRFQRRSHAPHRVATKRDRWALPIAGRRRKRKCRGAIIVQSIPNPSTRPLSFSRTDYVLADLTKTIGADKRISETSLARWLNGVGPLRFLNFPERKAEVEALLSDVRAGNVRRNTMAAELERAAANMKMTERQAGNSALALTLGKELGKIAPAGRNRTGIFGRRSEKEPKGCANTLQINHR